MTVDSRLFTGSEFSDRQIQQAALREQSVTAILPNDEEIVGWIYGMDGHHWGIVTEEGVPHLVHKSVPALSINPNLTLDSVADPDVVRSLTNPYRNMLRSLKKENRNEGFPPGNTPRNRRSPGGRPARSGPAGAGHHG